MIPQILLASTLQTLLVQTNLLFQILYMLLLEYVFLFDCSKLYLTNFMNIPMLVSKLHIIHSPSIATFHFLKNGFPFSYMIVLNVNVINTSIKKFKLLQHKRFQNMLRLLISAFLWTLKDLLINPPSHNKSYIHVVIDAFSHFVVTVPIKSNNAKTAIKTLLHHWIIKFGPLIYLVTDRGSEYVNKEMAHLCTLMGIRHSPRTAYSPWTNGLVEVQNTNLGTHLRTFFHDTPKDWAFQVLMYAYTHNSQPLPELNVTPHEIVFHTRPRIPLNFDLNLTRDTS